MTREGIVGAKIGIVILLGIGGALAVPSPAYGCSFLDFGVGRILGVYEDVPCGPATFTRLLMLGGAALIALWMWQRELKRQEAEDAIDDEPLR